MFSIACCCKCDIFDMNYVASLLYFANKVNLEKSHKSAKCVCYHQIRATKMEQVINFPGSEALQRIDIDCQPFNILNVPHQNYFWEKRKIIEKGVILGKVRISLCIRYSNRSQASWTRSK